jgi:hypothetical protein
MLDVSVMQAVNVASELHLRGSLSFLKPGRTQRLYDDGTLRVACLSWNREQLLSIYSQHRASSTEVDNAYKS